MIRFGPWSTLLSLGVVFGGVMALALALRPANRVANRLLAALMACVALKLVPYAIGYAGFYDACPWLSFAPFDIGLALGPLLWLHVVALTSGRLPPRWGWHLLPAALELAYYSLCFVQPLAWKNHWDGSVHAPWVNPLEQLLVAASLALYLRAAWLRRRRYQAWLAGHVSNAEDHRFNALRNLIVAMTVLLVLEVAFELATFVARLNYFQRFPLYVALTALLYALGLEGWRQADRRQPHPSAQPERAPPAQRPEPAESTRATDWQALGEQWRQRTAAAAWWRDPDLGLDSLARLLGTNSSYLSRAFNEGLGANFAQVIGEMRVAWVQAQLAADADPGDLLQLALAAGFSSKTSFNRVFKAATGQTPSAYRAAVRGATSPGAGNRRAKS